MIIKDVNFTLTDENTANFSVHVGEKITLFVFIPGFDFTETFDGEIRGVYMDVDGIYRLCLYGKCREHRAIEEPSLHEIYLPYIRDWEYPIS